MRKVAIFDIDGTLFRSSLLIEMVEVLVDGGIFSANVRDIYEVDKSKWLDRKGDYDAYIESVVEVFMKNLIGVEYSDFDRAVKVVYGRYKDRVYKYTRELIRELRSKKYFLIAISQSPKGVLDPFCKRYGFDRVYGRFYATGPDATFTGVVEDEHLISNKANIVRRILKKEGLDLKGSIGVGDTEGDISFLEMVDRPICFNPNAKLLSWAKRNGAKVVVERKDVIYKIK